MSKRFILAFLSLWITVAGWATPTVPLDTKLDEVSLIGHLQWLEDPSGSLALEDVKKSQNWRTLDDMLNVGYTSSTIWLKLTVVQPNQSNINWILSVDSVSIGEINFFSPDSKGQWGVQKAGSGVEFHAWPIKARTPSFRLNPPPGTHDIYLTLKSELSLSTAINLKTSEAFRTSGTIQALLYGSYFGISATIILLQLFFWLMGRHKKITGWHLAYTLTLIFGTAISSGYLVNYINLSNSISSTLIALYLCMAPSAIAKLTVVWLELEKHNPSFNKIYQLTIYTFSIITCLMVLGGEHGLAVKLSQALTLVWLQVSFGIGLILWLRGTSSAGYYLIIFGFIDLAVMIRFMRNLGLLPAGMETDYALNIGITLHLISMSLYFIYRFRNLETSLAVEQQARKEQREFVAMVSHEFRTPLAIINTSIQQLSSNLDAPLQKTQRRAQNIRNAVQRMNLLLDDYLSMDRLDSAHQPARMRSSDLYEVIEEAASDWPLDRIRLEIEELPQDFVCDPDLLRIALRNILANADRHSPEASVITVKAWSSANTVNITIQDQGEGIPPDELSRLFQKYFRGRYSQGKPGAGLGLYLVKRIIHTHGGEVTVQSLDGAGTTFTVNLPNT